MPVFKNICFKAYQSIFEYFLLFPIFLLFGILFIRDDQLWYWLLIVFFAYVIGIVSKTFIKSQKWWLFSLLSIIIGACLSIPFANGILLTITLPIIHTLLTFRGMMYVGRSQEELLPTSFLWIGGLIVYFISYFIFRYNELLYAHLNYLTIFGLIFITLTMFMSNNDHLKTATLSQDKQPFVSRAIKKQNRIFLVATIILIIVITNGDRIREGIWNTVRGFIAFIFGLFSGSEGEEIVEEIPPTSATPELPFAEPKEPSWLAKLLEVITTYLVYGFLAIVAILLIFLLIKKTRKWMIDRFKQFLKLLKNAISQITDREESTQYVEEKETVFDWKKWKETQQSKAKGFVKQIFKRKPKWNQLTNEQKVRFVFQEFVVQEIAEKHYKPYHTPYELLESIKLLTMIEDHRIEQLRMAYEQTRYGKQDVDEEIIRDIYELIHRT